MNKGRDIVPGVHLTDRVQQAPRVQELFTEYGCRITTRVGLHEVSEEFCWLNGLMPLEMAGLEGPISELIRSSKPLKASTCRRWFSSMTEL